ncbi:hypothetical protein DYB30_000640 [Aphanomyces astaci]|uniref:N-acetyltransferase domain-containing protein n=1 Tax=Aphanomyces astaci TaxID=112090 RepID=A0A397DW75_APHAT|nr:hypothetical protein DYB30_000640 [Aphanomyces astaci]RHY79113.1 hypothetical protein DYB26_011144 [Aphanomyces astaci]
MEIVELDATSIASVRRLNLAALPIPVQDHIYREALTPPILSWVALRDGKVLGAALVHDDDGGQAGGLCLRTIAVDIRARGQGIGRLLLEKVVEHASSMMPKKKLYLHVQVDNDDAIRLYQRLGFSVEQRVANYYRRVACVDCFVMALVFPVLRTPITPPS